MDKLINARGRPRGQLTENMIGHHHLCAQMLSILTVKSLMTI